MRHRLIVLATLLLGVSLAGCQPMAERAPSAAGNRGERPTVDPLPVQQARAYPETATGRFVSLADFEDAPGSIAGFRQVEQFSVAPGAPAADRRFVVNITRTGAGALEVCVPARAELVFDVPDLHDFLRHITPVLERRLASSFAAGYSGELKVSFVQGGLRLAFERGHLKKIAPMSPAETDPSLEPRDRDAIFPGLVFLQLLFGFRSVGELEYAFPDCGASSEETRALLDVLFPKHPSSVWGLEG